MNGVSNFASPRNVKTLLLRTLASPTLPPMEHYKGRYFPNIDLLRWAENSLLQRVFTLYQMK